MGAIFSLSSSLVPRIHYPDAPVSLSVRKSRDSEDVERLSLRVFIESRCPSLYSRFRPAWWLFNGHLQTIYCVLGDFSKTDKVLFDRKYLRVPDGGTMGLDFARPTNSPSSKSNVNEDTPVIVVMAGLTGGSHEPYVHSILAPACAPVEQGGLGYRAVVVNSRGCSGVPITSPQLYSAGHTDDLRQALIYISKVYPKAPLLGVGFSLGANIITRYLGEEGKDSRLVTACCLGCPWNLLSNTESLSAGLISRHVYAKAMGSNLQELVRRHATAFSKFSERGLAELLAVTLKLKSPIPEDFDENFTRHFGGSSPPHGPFPLKSARDYYIWCSSHKIVADVRVPFLAINAADDPIVQDVPMDAGGNPWAVMVLTRSGGHLGWFESSRQPVGVSRWINKPVLEWLRACGNDMVHDLTTRRPLHDRDGFLKEEGRDHLGCKEIDGGGLITGTEGGEGLLAGL